MMAALQLPFVYEGLGLSEPPTSFTPPSGEEYWGTFKILSVPQDTE